MEQNLSNGTAGPVSGKRSKIHYGWLVMISCGLIEFGDIGIFANCAGVFTQPVCDELGFLRADFNLYFSIVTLVMALTMPIAQKVMNRYNIRIIISSVILLECLAFGLMSQYSSITGWYVSAVMLGLGQAYLTYLLVPFVLNNWFKVKYGVALGIASACSTLGGAIFSPITGQLITHFGWRTSYLILALCALVITLPCTIIILRARPDDIGMEPYGAEELRKARENSPAAKEEELKGFTAKESVHTPYLYLCIIFTIGLTFAANFINQITPFAYTLGFPVAQGSMISSMVLVGGVLGNLTCGGLTDRYSIKVGISSGLLGGIIGMLLLLFSNAVVGLVFIGAFCFGLTLALLNLAPPLLTRVVMGKKDFSNIYSYIGMTITLTSAVAAWSYGKIYDVTGAYNLGLVLALGCLAVALVSTFIADRTGKKLWGTNK